MISERHYQTCTELVLPFAKERDLSFFKAVLQRYILRLRYPLVTLPFPLRLNVCSEAGERERRAAVRKSQANDRCCHTVTTKHGLRQTRN